MTKNGKIYQIFKSHFQINFVQINWVFGCLGYLYRILFFKVWSNGYFLGMTTKVFLEHNALTVYFYWKIFLIPFKPIYLDGEIFFKSLDSCQKFCPNGTYLSKAHRTPCHTHQKRRHRVVQKKVWIFNFNLVHHNSFLAFWFFLGSFLDLLVTRSH